MQNWEKARLQLLTVFRFLEEQNMLVSYSINDLLDGKAIHIKTIIENIEEVLVETDNFFETMMDY